MHPLPVTAALIVIAVIYLSLFVYALVSIMRREARDESATDDREMYGVGDDIQ